MLETGRPFLSRDALQLGVGGGHDAEDAPFLLQFLPLVHRLLSLILFGGLFLLGLRLKQCDC